MIPAYITDQAREYCKEHGLTLVRVENTRSWMTNNLYTGVGVVFSGPYIGTTVSFDLIGRFGDEIQKA
jgi:hypothetical protein